MFDIYIRRVQVKTTVRYHLTLGRMTYIKTSRCWPRTWKKKNPVILLVEMQTGSTALANYMELSQNTRNGLPISSSDSTPRNLSRGLKTTKSDIYSPIFIVVLFAIAKICNLSTPNQIYGSSRSGIYTQ